MTEKKKPVERKLEMLEGPNESTIWRMTENDVVIDVKLSLEAGVAIESSGHHPLNPHSREVGRNILYSK